MHHFLANVLNIMFMLSMNFLKEYVGVTYVHWRFGYYRYWGDRKEISISCYYRSQWFKKDSNNYLVIPQYGKQKGMLYILRDGTKSNEYKSIIMDRSMI